MEMSGLCSFAGCPAAWGQPSTFTAQPLRGGLGGNKHLAALPASKDAVEPPVSCILEEGEGGGYDLVLIKRIFLGGGDRYILARVPGACPDTL